MRSTFRQSINWGQAFAEVLLIFLGVAIALLADRWADERSERSEERQYLQALQADFLETEVSLEQSLADVQANRDVKLEFMALLQGPPEAVPEDRLSRLIRESFYMQMLSVRLATYADMVNSGDLRLLRNAQLKLELAEFENQWRDYRMIIAEGFDQWNLLHVPFLVANTKVANLYSSGYFNVEFPSDGTPIERDAIWSREFENILAVSIITREDMLVVGEQLLVQAREILALIDRSLEES